MNVDSIQNGYVIDHIRVGKAMEIYHALDLGKLDCSVAILVNVPSSRMGRKDIIKIDKLINLNFDVLGYIDPNLTVNTITNNNVSKRRMVMPKELKNVITCANPRCITSIEQELPQVFKLTDPVKHTYRCIYCEVEAPKIDYTAIKH
ncbi:MAG: aspartate carbamoyltransferase regulatory subunit [Clostridia bacterium]|nr:aspartate carbamoyltransferase regulatory subunit [Clostridia bacterium]